MTSLLSDLIAAAKASPFRRCEWCGWPCYGRSCSAHRDLTQLQHANQSPPPHHLEVENAAADSRPHGG